MDIQYNSLFNSQMNHFKVEIYNSGYAKLDRDWDANDYAGSMSRLYFIESGEGQIVYDDQTLLIKPGIAYFIPAGITWSWQSSTPIRKFFIDFNLFKPNGENLFIDSSSILTLPCSQNEIREMVKWYCSDTTEDWFYLKVSLYKTLADVIRKSNLKVSTVAYHPIVLDTVKYIQKNLSLNLSLQALADRSFVSKTFLSSQFKKEIGMSIGQYIDTQVLMYARIDLEQKKLSIAEISNKYGFCDQFYFSRFFKKYLGESPSRYRSHFNSPYCIDKSDSKLFSED